MTLLSIKNFHQRDERIKFISDGHIYKIDDGTQTYTSVTTFIKSFFGKFDADKVIQAMIKSGSFSIKYPDKTAEEVKEEWNKSGIEAASLGTLMHESIENYYNDINKPVEPIISREYGFFLEFHKYHIIPRGFEAFRTEWYVFIEEYKIAGSIDMVYQMPNGNLCIYDWKRSKKIEYNNRWKKGKKPVDHLDDCNYYHYSLQLNMYKYILENKYNKQVEILRLIFLHPQNYDYIVVDVPDLQKEIASMLASKTI